MVSQKPPRFEFHHRHCDDPEAYLSKADKKKMHRKINGAA
jgi:hypothetical protein